MTCFHRIQYHQSISAFIWKVEKLKWNQSKLLRWDWCKRLYTNIPMILFHKITDLPDLCTIEFHSLWYSACPVIKISWLLLIMWLPVSFMVRFFFFRPERLYTYFQLCKIVPLHTIHIMSDSNANSAASDGAMSSAMNWDISGNT